MGEMEVIESLRQKEEELNNLLMEARAKALKIREDALRRSEETRRTLTKELEAMLEEHRKAETERIDKEAEAIKADGIRKAQLLKSAAEERIEKTVEMGVQHVIESKGCILQIINCKVQIANFKKCF